MVDIFRRHQWLGFFKLLKGYDDDLAIEFSMALNSQTEDNSTTIVRGLVISFNLKIVSTITTLPLGLKWRREDKATSVVGKNNFLISKENPIEDKNGLRIEGLTYPWD